MKLVCPSCESSFLVDTDAIGPTGRTVRCGRCGNSWLAMPIEGVPEDLSPAPEEPRDDAPADAADSLDRPGIRPPSQAEFESARRRSRRVPDGIGTEAGKRGSAVGWLLFALVAAALVAGVALGREQIMAWAPESRALYAMVRLAEEQPLPSLPRIQLKLRDVTSDRRQVDGTPSLVIEGKVFNPTDETQDVPPLVATLMDPTGIELKRWVFAADTESLPPGGHAAFHTSTQNPPGQGNLNLNFVPHRR